VRTLQLFKIASVTGSVANLVASLLFRPVTDALYRDGARHSLRCYRQWRPLPMQGQQRPSIAAIHQLIGTMRRASRFRGLGQQSNGSVHAVCTFDNCRGSGIGRAVFARARYQSKSRSVQCGTGVRA
jgi:hypothetical protein